MSRTKNYGFYIITMNFKPTRELYTDTNNTRQPGRLLYSLINMFLLSFPPLSLSVTGSQVSLRSTKSSTTILVTDDGAVGHDAAELEEAADNLVSAIF